MTVSGSLAAATTERASPRTPLFRSRDAAGRDLLVIRPEDIAEQESPALERPAANAPAFAQETSIAFGDFRLLPGKRLLLKNGAPVNVGARAFDVLVMLAERPGEVISRKEIEARAYPGLTVGEGALRFQIAALRKALGDGRNELRYIANVSGRGYCFAAPVVRSEHAPPTASAGSNDNVPSALQHGIDFQGAVGSIRAAIANRSDLAGIVSAVAPVANFDEPITVVFSLLGRRATLILDNLPAS
jgi:DNA-binding winged helix-turn-helix (wHTH) protein